ncbi:hypothetical protein C1645_823511 [Glomus cerebriforme]|uniref:Uncharacterized protein n=1 Tax=Glomus cerebriforme TaxID=658196 RepID=A0A397SVR1_9GLOM|nr:hypothetical protein C1645_823511 [Glomus cerebriforme]
MKNAYHSPEESEKEANKEEENNIVIRDLKWRSDSIRYEGSLKTAIKKVVLKYNNGNENTDYSKNKNHRLTSSQKSVPVDDEELDESDESDESDK